MLGCTRHRAPAGDAPAPKPCRKPSRGVWLRLRIGRRVPQGWIYGVPPMRRRRHAPIKSTLESVLQHPPTIRNAVKESP